MSRLFLLSRGAMMRQNFSSTMVFSYRFNQTKVVGASKNNNDNKSNQMNPNNEKYFKGHGWGKRPENFEDHNPQEGNNRGDQLNPNNEKGGNPKGGNSKGGNSK